MSPEIPMLDPDFDDTIIVVGRASPRRRAKQNRCACGEPIGSITGTGRSGQRMCVECAEERRLAGKRRRRQGATT